MMMIAEEIRTLKHRTELLAPAGRWDALEAVLEAGADAVYVSGKRFQMRQHRGDFHFDDVQLGEAVRLVHDRRRRIYVTVNSLLADHELADARSMLARLDEIGVDAIIVQDLATIALAREVGTTRALHASTMMNVHDVDQARVLADLGITRIITSRDISIQDAGLISQEAEVEVEYFLHGDMCVAQSGQCSLSGVVLGKSSNRGECMKPCRWQYDLVSTDARHAQIPLRSGHLMAIKDLCLLRQIPELIAAGICGLKIEGRMRDAAYLRHLVGLYREAIDGYYDLPSAFLVRSRSLESMLRHRVRDVSCLATTGAPSGGRMFDVGGRREPLFLADGAREARLGIDELGRQAAAFEPPSGASNGSVPDLAVCVSSVAAALEAVEAGADRVYVAAETAQFGGGGWSRASLREAAEVVAGRAALGLRTPRITDRRQQHELDRLVDVFDEAQIAYVLVHHLGTLERARRRLPDAAIIADFGFNVLNCKAIEVLKSLGADAVVPSNEAGYEDVKAMALSSPLPIELPAHGPVSGMLLEHCLIAMHLTKTGAKDVCRGPCQHARFGLRDRHGEVRPIMADQYCRNHLLTAKDLAILPSIDAFLGLGVASLRIDGQWYTPRLVGLLTAAYRWAIDGARDGNGTCATSDGGRGTRRNARGHSRGGGVSPGAWQAILDASPRPLNYGAYVQRVTHAASTLEVMRAAR